MFLLLLLCVHDMLPPLSSQCRQSVKLLSMNLFPHVFQWGTSLKDEYNNTHKQPLCVQGYSIVIFLLGIKPQSALWPRCIHRPSCTQLRQGGRDKLHIKTTTDEIWSVLIVSGSAILLTTASDDVWGTFYLSRRQQPESLYNYQQREINNKVTSSCISGASWFTAFTGSSEIWGTSHLIRFHRTELLYPQLGTTQEVWGGCFRYLCNCLKKIYIRFYTFLSPKQQL